MQQTEESSDWWHQIWAKGEIFWRQPAPHEYLVRYFGQYTTTESPKVLIPLIGNTVDAKWLYDKGCQVTGVDICDAPIKQLYEQHSIAYNRVQTEHPEFSLYHNQDYKLRVFHGDFYRFRKEVANCQFDFIWDRAAMSAINMVDRQKYVSVFKNVLSASGSILLIALNYDISKYHGPPHYITKGDMDRLFGQAFAVQLLDKRDVLKQWRNKDWGIDWLEESAYLMKWKAN